jgi:hypothetical protein
MQTDTKQDAEMRYDSNGVSLSLGTKSLGRIEGGTVRLITDKAGKPQALLGISEQQQKVKVRLSGRPWQEIFVEPNQRIAL